VVAAVLGVAAMVMTACGPPPDAKFDYQIGGDYSPEAGVEVVSRDWFSGSPLAGAYSICYINAFQTQGNYSWVDRPDEQNNWPQNLVLTSLGDDPNWGGEYLIDISTSAKRSQAAGWVEQMVDGCAASGFDAVEFDNLDSWTRFDGTPLAGQVPFGEAEAKAYATLLTDYTHSKLLASGHKNTTDLLDDAEDIGFDFAVVESCGLFDECTDFTAVYDRVVAIEYTNAGFATACAEIGGVASVVRRDVNVSMPGSGTYIYDEC
jgi:hypothetical protein